MANPKRCRYYVRAILTDVEGTSDLHEIIQLLSMELRYKPQSQEEVNFYFIYFLEGK